MKIFLLALLPGLGLLAPAAPPSARTGAGPGSFSPPPTLPAAPAASAVGLRSRVDALAERALHALDGAIVRQSHSAALRSAFEAYFAYRGAHPEQAAKPYLYYVDFGLPATEPRGYIFDMDALRLVEGPFTVSHGSGSAPGGTAVPTRFSNRPGSNATSLGLYLTLETYGFRGKAGGRAYRSTGLRLRGLSAPFNGAARSRGIVVHGAPYVTARRAGRSHGCPAMELARAELLLPLLAGGSLVFHFSPRDPDWLAGDPWLDADRATQ